MKCEHEIVHHGLKIGGFTRTGAIKLSELKQEIHGRWSNCKYDIVAVCPECGWKKCWRKG